MYSSLKIIPYAEECYNSCMDIFISNTPDYFAYDEQPHFEDWLKAQGNGKLAHPVSEKEFYYVLIDLNKVIGCAGFLLAKNSGEIYLSWGMVHRQFQKLGYGKLLLDYRLQSIEQSHPNKKIRLSTTQDIAPFFEHYGFKTINIKEKYYAQNLDRYEMEKFSNLPKS